MSSYGGAASLGAVPVGAVRQPDGRCAGRGGASLERVAAGALLACRLTIAGHLAGRRRVRARALARRCTGHPLRRVCPGAASTTSPGSLLAILGYEGAKDVVTYMLVLGLAHGLALLPARAAPGRGGGAPQRPPGRGAARAAAGADPSALPVQHAQPRSRR